MSNYWYLAISRDLKNNNNESNYPPLIPLERAKTGISILPQPDPPGAINWLLNHRQSSQVNWTVNNDRCTEDTDGLEICYHKMCYLHLKPQALGFVFKG